MSKSKLYPIPLDYDVNNPEIARRTKEPKIGVCAGE